MIAGSSLAPRFGPTFRHLLFGAMGALQASCAAPEEPRQAPRAAVRPSRDAVCLVFFDRGSVEIDERGRQLIAEAARTLGAATGTTRIEMGAHADRSGSSAYNQRLSQRRAEAVAAQLVRHGVKAEQITLRAFGETRPLVPTQDGVREPQNRRVEIVQR
jgi:OmpA-OmpF porin, OOP family